MMLRILVFLLLGAIVNVAVAWTISQSIEPMSYTKNRDPQFGHYQCPQTNTSWRLAYLSKPGFASLKAVEQRGRAPGAKEHWFGFEELPTWSRFRDSSLGSSHLPYLPMWNEYAWGWPLLAMTLRQECNPSKYAQQTFAAIAMPFRTPTATTPRPAKEFLPTGLVWPGFAINTVFYGMILWLLFAAPFALRRWRRIRRGLCVKCGYDLRGSRSQSPHPNTLPPHKGEGHLVCPECGAAVSPNPRAG